MAPGLGEPPAIQFDHEANVAKMFIDEYYRTFDHNRQGLVSFFRDMSTISFEGTSIKGGANYVAKLQQMGVPMPCQHRIVTRNAQPSLAGQGAILVFVTGELLGKQFAEVFQLVPDGASFFVFNNVFRVGNTNPYNVPAECPVAKPFLEYYFQTYDSNRNQLVSLFRPNSVLSFEDDNRVGPPSIMEKLATLPRVVHDAASLTCDVQQVNGNQIVLIFVSGRLSIDESNPLNFSETFLLFAEGQSYYIGNSIFRLKYG